jgi:hypothetical protein
MENILYYKGEAVGMECGATITWFSNACGRIDEILAAWGM